MSANLVVDIGNTCQFQASVSPVNGVDSTPASGVIIGQIVDLLNANTFCNIFVAGGPSSGLFQVNVQTSDGTTSGSFTDPTSGLAQMPTAFQSGGRLWVNSGLWPATDLFNLGAHISGAPMFASGGVLFAAFQRPHRYARVNVVSGGTFIQPVTAGFVSQAKVTSSGGGFSYSPSSGVVNV